MKNKRKNLYDENWDDHYKEIKKAKKNRRRKANMWRSRPTKLNSGLVTPPSGSRSGICTKRKMTEDERKKYGC